MSFARCNQYTAAQFLTAPTRRRAKPTLGPSTRLDVAHLLDLPRSPHLTHSQPSLPSIHTFFVSIFFGRTPPVSRSGRCPSSLACSLPQYTILANLTRPLALQSARRRRFFSPCVATLRVKGVFLYQARVLRTRLWSCGSRAGGFTCQSQGCSLPTTQSPGGWVFLAALLLRGELFW